MPLHVEEFVIQAKFEDESTDQSQAQVAKADVESLREDIIHECMEKLEEYIRKRESR